MKNIFTLVAGAIFTLITLPVMAGSLSGDEIKSTFSGKTAIGDHLKKGMSVKSFHAADGSYKRVLSDGSVTTGKWWVEGDTLCVKFDGQSKDRCRLIESDGGSGYKKIKPNKGKAVVHFKNLEEGDVTQ